MTISKALALYARLLEAIMISLVFILLAVVGLQIVGRYLPFLPRYLWTEELANHSLVWIVFCGTILGVKQNKHFAVDLLPEQMPNWLWWVTKSIYYLAMYSISVLFVWYGIRFAGLGLLRRSILLNVRLIVVYIGVPICGLSWLGYITMALIEDVRQSHRGADDSVAGGVL